MQKKHIVLFLILTILICGFYVLHLYHPLTLALLKEKREALFLRAETSPYLSALTLSACYVLSVFLVIPDSTVLNILLGMLYPLPYAVLIGALSETAGALLFFLTVRAIVGSAFLQKKIPYRKKIEKQFQKSPASYLLFFRLSHVVPYWLTNILAAAFHAPAKTFAWTIFVGVLPFCYLTAEAGKSLMKTLKHNPNAPFHELFDTQTKLLFLGVGLLAFLPIVIKKFFLKKGRFPINRR